MSNPLMIIVLCQIVMLLLVFSSDIVIKTPHPLNLKTRDSKTRNKKIRKQLTISFLRIVLGDPLGARTQDPNIKSVVLYQLS